MVQGVRALMFSAEYMPEDADAKPSKLDAWIEKRVGGEKAEKLIITIAVVLGVGLSIGLFILLPTLLAGLLDDFAQSAVLRNLIEGVLRISIFLVYMWLATKAKDIKRVWAYHGAEHKAIFTYEKNLELTVETARAQSRFHPRCGTSFLIIVMLVSILLSAPGKALQRLTTREPDENMLEVALEALRRVIPEKAGEDAW
jgi:uncharacterized protein YqhQ